MRDLTHRIDIFCQKVIQDRIDSGGLSFKKPSSGILLFYAGASDEVILALDSRKHSNNPNDHLPNWKEAASEATRLNAMRIDDTYLFDYLNSKEFPTDLMDMTGISGFEVGLASKQVWDFVSDKFAHTAFCEAATLVCGAGDHSSFMRKELLGMLDVVSLRIVNKRAADLFRAFRALGKEEVQGLACATYLRALKRYALAYKDAGRMALYKRERGYFLTWRRIKRRAQPSATAEQRQTLKQTRRAILENHRAGRFTPSPHRATPQCHSSRGGVKP